MEEDDLVEAVEELGPEMLAQRHHDRAANAFRQLDVGGPGRAVVLRRFRDVLAAQVGRHDHDRVLEIDRAALAVGQPAVVEELKKDVQHLGMRLLDLVEEDHGIGAAADRLGQLAGLLVAHVSGRRADHPGHGVLLLVLRHVDPDHRLVVVEQELGQRPCQLRLADAGRAEEHEAAERPVGILQPGTRATNRVRDGVDGLVLSDDALVQPLFHVQQFLDFAFHHPADRDVRPPADDLGDVFFVDFLLEHPLVLLQRGQRPFLVANLLFELGPAAVLKLGGLRVVARALRALDLEPQRFELLLQLARPLNRFLLLLPVGGERVALFLQIGQLLLEPLEPFLGGLVLFLLQRLALDLELHDAPRQLVELRGHRVDLHAQLGRGFVHQIDGLVGEEPIGDVAVREDGGARRAPSP